MGGELREWWELMLIDFDSGKGEKFGCVMLFVVGVFES